MAEEKGLTVIDEAKRKFELACKDASALQIVNNFGAAFTAVNVIALLREALSDEVMVGTDVKDNKDGESENVQGVIAVGGNGGQVIKGLANFFTEKQTAPLAAEAMELATLKKLSRLLENE
jgi:hypothetical protein